MTPYHFINIKKSNMEQYETYVPGMVGKNKSREEGFNNESPVVNEEKKVFSKNRKFF